jgi:hypothetical protein
MRKIPAKYNEIKQKVKDELKDVCLTTDIWTSGNC